MNDVPGEIRFVENAGQWKDPFDFKLPLNGGAVFFEQNKVIFSFLDQGGLNEIHHWKHEDPSKNYRRVLSHTIDGHAYVQQFQNANPKPIITGLKPYKDYKNYYTSRNPEHWVSGVQSFRKLHFASLYDGIDMVYHSKACKHGGESHLKYDFIVSAGANPDLISWTYEGADNVRLNKNGALEIETSVRSVTELKPFAFQILNGDTIEVPCFFVLENKNVRFEFPAGYDKSKKLIIDPELIFSTFTGSSADNWGYTATYDSQGNFYAGGVVRDDGVYPTTPGAFQTSFGGGTGIMNWDIGISKFTADGSSLIYSTYLGGSFNEIPHSIIVNDNDELVVYGTTGSVDFPITPNAFDTTFNGGDTVLVTNVILFPNGSDIFLAVFSADGSSLTGSTYVGGSGNDGLNIPETIGSLHYNYGDHARGEVIVDSANNIIVGSMSPSNDFPVTQGVFQENYTGGQMGVVFKMNPNLTSMEWGSYIGGSGMDAVYSIKIGDNEDIFMTGGTTSSNFPTTTGTLNASYPGGVTSGYVTRINQDATSIIASSFLGTAQYDQSYFLQIDAENRIYLLGQSLGGYPTTSDSYINPNSTQFIHMISPELDSTYFSTVFGNGSGTVNISPTAFLVDNCYNIYISGWGGLLVNYSYTGNIQNMPVTANAFQTTVTSGTGFYFFIVSPFAENLIYATYFSGNMPASREHVDGGTSRFDQNGIIYQAICADCGTNNAFPTTPGAWSNQNNSVNCNLGAVKYQFNIANVEVDVEALPSTTGCVPFTVDFNSNGINATHYFWDFGDGNLSNDENPTHTFFDPGTYQVQLIGVDSNLCAGVYRTDTSFVTVIVSDDSVKANFDINVLNDCGTYVVELINLSQNGSQYLWDFGDGNTSTSENPVHTFDEPGEYLINFSVFNPNVCFQTDSVFEEISFLPEMLLQPEGPDTAICVPEMVTFNTELFLVDEFKWIFEGGIEISDTSFQVEITDPGNYTVLLIGEGTDVCNPNDTVAINFIGQVSDTVFADFNLNVVSDCGDYVVTFDNQSIAATSYTWDFGDGQNSSDFEPTHQYSEAGEYLITLIANNPDFCIDKDTFQLAVEFLPELNVEIDAPTVIDCAPALVELNAIENNAETLFWFVDGQLISSDSITDFSIQEPGTYEVILVGQSSGTCNPNDTAFTEIIVLEDSIQADFAFDVLSECGELIIDFSNQSVGEDEIEWFVNEVPFSSDQQFTFSETDTGQYIIELVVKNTACLLKDTVAEVFSLLPAVRALPDSIEICAPADFDMTAISQNAESVEWYQEGNFLSDQANLEVTINESGEYVYQLIASNESSCNLSDTATYLVNVFPSPVAEFFTDTNVYMIFDEIEFVNTSEGMPIFEWDMGDGFTSSEQVFVYVYYDEGTYEVCLSGENAFGCEDHICQPIKVLFERAIGVPDAFTPNGDGMNDILYVRGFGISELRFRVYNRWGEMVFESDNQETGWDGTYRGVDQETEVYVYVLEATFLDGTEFYEKGNVTLLR